MTAPLPLTMGAAASPCANYHVISSEPLIVMVSGPLRGIRDLAAALGGRKACFLATFWWHHDPDQADPLLRFLAHYRAAGHRLISLCNESDLHELLERHGFESEFCHHNCFVDERLFAIANVEKQFDAVYNANFDAFKRHHLATALDDLAIITYMTQTAGADRVREMRRAFPQWHWLNFAGDVYRHLSAAEVCQWLNRARVGLCLSACEGGMFASAEYLLCGLPVVSTRSRGGRSEFFDDDFVAIVDDDPGAVRQAVRAMIERRPQPTHIRARTLARIAEHRHRFIAAVQRVYDDAGVQRDFSAEWPYVFINKMYRTQPCERVLDFVCAADVTGAANA